MVIRAFVGAEIANCLPRSNSLTAFGLLLWPASVAHSEWNSSVALSAAAASTLVSEKCEIWAYQLTPVIQTDASWIRSYAAEVGQFRQLLPLLQSASLAKEFAGSLPAPSLLLFALD